jgi:hypothetical protein
MQHNAEQAQKLKQFEKEESRAEQRSKRRWRFKIPFLPVGIDLKGEKSV